MIRTLSRILPTPGRKALLAVAVCLAGTAAAPASPIFDTFGPLPQATFGGTGIPNTEVAVSSTFEDGDNIITVALSATQRFSNPPLTNDGAGTYFATVGSNFGGNGQSMTEGALWNFNFYIDVDGINGATPVLADYQIHVFYDFDPAADTPLSSLGRIDITAGLGLAMDTVSTTEEGSQNLLFDFLENPVFPFNTVVFPPAGSFDPNASGEYTFAITVSSGGFPAETVSTNVVVVPEPAALSLLGFVGVGAALRRRRVS